MKAYEKIECAICGHKAHLLELHVAQMHGMGIDDYQDAYPGAPVLSEAAKAKLKELERRTRAGKVDVNIKKAFGVRVSKTVDTVRGFDVPHENTPEIDPDYVFGKGLLKVALFGLETGEKVLFTGPTGSGKSSIVEQVAARLNLNFYRINFDADITRADLVGQWVLVGKDMIFSYGILPKAMREGAVLLLDEWDLINPSVGMLLQPVLEGKSLTITETGEVIKPHKDFRIFATSNTLGQGDETGLYNGTQPQNFAQLDRFQVVEIVNYPKKAQEIKILQKKTGIQDEQIINKMLEFAGLVRSAFLKQEVLCTLSTRTLVNIANKLLAFGGVKRAYELAFINKLNADDRTFCYEILQRVWGGDL